jgi:hypothetical protein
MFEIQYQLPETVNYCVLLFVIAVQLLKSEENKITENCSQLFICCFSNTEILFRILSCCYWSCFPFYFQKFTIEFIILKLFWVHTVEMM